MIDIPKTNEEVSKTKTRYTQLKNWIKVISLLYEKTLSGLMIHEGIDGKKQELNKIYNLYLDERTDPMKDT